MFYFPLGRIHRPAPCHHRYCDVYDVRRAAMRLIAAGGLAIGPAGRSSPNMAA